MNQLSLFSEAKAATPRKKPTAVSRRHFLFGRASDFPADEDGATAIEYGLIASLIGVTLVFTLTRTGRRTRRAFRRVRRGIRNR